MLELIYGTGFADDLRGIRDDDRVRIYRRGNLAILGTDTDDCFYVCDLRCELDLIRSDPHNYVETDSGTAWITRGPVSSDPYSSLRYFATIDVTDDPEIAEETYIECANCGTVLYRDDLAHLNAYGSLISRASEEWSGDDRKIWSGLVSAEESGSMIDADTAHVIAAQWHGGQSSALYSFVSTGRVFDTTADDLRAEIDEEITTLERRKDSDDGRDIIALRALRAFIIGTFPSYFDPED